MSKTAITAEPGIPMVTIAREFDAPRHLVYLAYTTPELMRRWWHANRAEITVS